MENYKISYNGDTQIKNIHHIGVDYNGNYYSVIFGELMKSFTKKIVMELHGKKKIKLSKWDDSRSI